MDLNFSNGYKPINLTSLMSKIYEIYATDTFKDIYSSLDKTERNWITKTKKKLQKSPTGKILAYSWFREKKYLNKRLYFLIDEENKKILLLSFSSKKEQQKIIDFVKSNMKDLVDYLKRIQNLLIFPFFKSSRLKLN